MLKDMKQECDLVELWQASGGQNEHPGDPPRLKPQSG